MSTRRPPRKPGAPRRAEPPARRADPPVRRADTSAPRTEPARRTGTTPHRAAPATGRAAPAATGRAEPGVRPGAARTPAPASARTSASPAARPPASATSARTPASPTSADREGTRRVVPAADRFRALVSPRPWLRRRRTILAVSAGLLVLVLAAVGVLLYAPAFRIADVEVAGTGYVDAQAVRRAADPALGTSILSLPAGQITADVEAIPGVESASVERTWPDGIRVTVRERTPIATVATADGGTAVVDAEGKELPAAAAEGATLVPLTVANGSSDPEGATDAMLEVLAELPADLRGSTSAVSASSRSDVTLTIAVGEGQKTVVWGDAQDAELKAEVVAALLRQPGTVIDVSSPVAPVTR